MGPPPAQVRAKLDDHALLLLPGGWPRDCAATSLHKPRLLCSRFACPARFAQPWPGFCKVFPHAVDHTPRVCALAGALVRRARQCRARDASTPLPRQLAAGEFWAPPGAYGSYARVLFALDITEVSVFASRAAIVARLPAARREPVLGRVGTRVLRAHK